jgi:histone H3/H4
MARTKQKKTRSVPTVAGKSLESIPEEVKLAKRIQLKNNMKLPKMGGRRRAKIGSGAKREIRRLQQAEDPLLFRYLPFERLCKEIAQEHKIKDDKTETESVPRFKVEAIWVLKKISETYMTELFALSDKCRRHRKLVRHRVVETDKPSGKKRPRCKTLMSGDLHFALDDISKNWDRAPTLDDVINKK